MITSQLEMLFRGEELPDAAVATLFDQMLSGALEPAHVGALLTAWRMRGERAAELAIGATAMRKQATKPAIAASLRPLADNCGTGGDGANTFNISTTAAIVAAATGVRLAKHGGRSVSSACGSADLLFAAGFPATLSAEAAGKLLASTGFTFFFAPNFHPVMKHVAPIRKALGVRTIFNLLGPLANPLTPEVQLVGVGAEPQIRPMAEALAKLGVKRAMVVHSQDGLDELSPCAPTDYALVEGRKVMEGVIDPRAVGVSGRNEDLAGADAETNVKILKRVLTKGAPGGGLADAIALNAGALLWLTDKAADLKTGLAQARETMASGRAETFFGGWIVKAKELADG